MKNRSRNKVIIFFVLIWFSFVSCQASNQTQQISSTLTPIPTPLSGQASMTGRVLNEKDGSPISNVAVRLAKVYRQGGDGAFVLDIARSPGNYSDQQGQFNILDFDPAEYFIVVGEPANNNYIIFQDSNGKPISFQTEAGKVFNVGDVKVKYTP